MLIDYCNDQCDMNPVSAQADGPPDEWVKWVCERLAEFVWRKKHARGESVGSALWLAHGAGSPSPSALAPQAVTAA
jgi:hypothetical protein